MDKNILFTFLFNEPKSFLVTEPFNNAFCQRDPPPFSALRTPSGVVTLDKLTELHHSEYKLYLLIYISRHYMSTGTLMGPRAVLKTALGLLKKGVTSWLQSPTIYPVSLLLFGYSGGQVHFPVRPASIRHEPFARHMYAVLLFSRSKSRYQEATTFSSK